MKKRSRLSIDLKVHNTRVTRFIVPGVRGETVHDRTRQGPQGGTDKVKEYSLCQNNWVFCKRMESLQKEWSLCQKNWVFAKLMESLPKELSLCEKNGVFAKRIESLPKEWSLPH